MTNTYEILSRLSRMNVEEIASLLVAEDCKGEPGMSRSCPMAKFLEKRTGKPHRVNHLEIIVNRYPITPEKLVCPVSVYHFVVKFDRGDYPELDSELNGSGVKAE